MNKEPIVTVFPPESDVITKEQRRQKRPLKQSHHPDEHQHRSFSFLLE